MTFQNKNLSVLAYANGFTLWHYNDPETNISEMETVGYFDSPKDLMAPGDIIMINCFEGAGLRQVCFDNKNIFIKNLNI